MDVARTSPKNMIVALLAVIALAAVAMLMANASAIGSDNAGAGWRVNEKTKSAGAGWRVKPTK